jgi:4-amino-4-deoxy-L-arabinose transferase-like glycosyltransferase
MTASSVPNLPQPAGRAPAWGLVGLLLALLLVVRLVMLVLWPLMDTTEARYADIARRMAELDDWVTPWFDTGVPFWGKPPLSFWMTRGSFEVFGLGELQARLPHFLCMMATVAVAAHLAAERSARQAVLVAVMLPASLVVFTASGAVQTDAPLVFGITLALASFWRVMHAPAGEPARWSRWLFFVGLAIGVLAKGPLAVVLSAFAVLGWLAATRRLANLWRRLPWLGGALLFAVLVVPWFVIAETRTPGFVQYFLIGEHLYRFTQPGWDGDRYGNAHHEAIGTIWAFAVAGWWPWTVLVPALGVWVVWQRQRQGSPNRRARPACKADERPWSWFTLAWAAGPLLLFTPARNTIWMYVLPGAVGAALWAAGWADRALSERAQRGLLLSGLVLALATVGAYVNDAVNHLDRRSTRELMHELTQLAPDASRTVFIGRRPFSAAYYSEGRAERMPDRAAMARELAHPPGPLVVVLPYTLGDEAPVIAGARADPLLTVGDYRAWRISPIR